MATSLSTRESKIDDTGIKEGLAAMLDAGGPITIDAVPVDDDDTAAVKIVMAAKRRSKVLKSAKKRPRKKVARTPATAKKKAAAKKAAAEEVPKLVLEGKLDIREVAALKARLAVILSADGPITIDAGRIESADTAVLQLLAAFVVSARQQSREPNWEQPPGALRESCKLLDLDRHLGFDADSESDSADDGGVVLCPVF